MRVQYRQRPFTKPVRLERMPTEDTFLRPWVLWHAAIGVLECQGMHVDEHGNPHTSMVLQPRTRRGVARFLRYHRHCGFAGD